MTDQRQSVTPGGADDLERLTDEVLPALVARLRASRLAELEVRSGGWRVRLRRDPRARRRSSTPGPHEKMEPEEPEGGADAAAAPAVGYFLPAQGLGVGQLVQAGDLLGSVDVLGIAQDVTAPCSGLVRALLVEPGQAVEYGQPLVEIDPLALELDVPSAPHDTAEVPAPATTPAAASSTGAVLEAAPGVEVGSS